MIGKTLLRLVVPLALSTLLGACTQKNTSDEQAQAAAASANVDLGIDRFLLFPNPIGMDPLAQGGGTFETNTSEYAAAYYRAIDPSDAKDTIDKWRAQNGFTGYANPARLGTEHLAVFRDVKDLGYGRRMSGRRNSDDGSIAFYVENYKVTPNAGTDYSSELNVEAAIRRDTQWHVGTNAIEWSTTPCIAGFDPADCDSTVKFAKYYNFSSKDGTRQLAVDLDGRGLKSMPGPCITCHGGRGDPLTPPDVSGKPRFPLVENILSRKRGDVEAHLHGQNVDSFSYSTSQPGFAKSDMQPFLKDFNQWILCTYPSPTLTPGLTVTGAWGTCTRPTAGANEWQAAAGPMIEYWYGGTGMGNPKFAERCDLSAQPCYVPSGWNNNTVVIPGTAITDTVLYTSVVAPYCRTCHILRGTKNQDDLDFTSLAKFQGYADRIKAHVFDRGNMPLSRIPHTDFWNSPAPQMLASFIDAQSGGAHVATSASGAVLMPGRPIADPGPDRMVRTGANAVLTAENSLFASTFAWSQPMPSGNVTITNPNGMVAIFNASVAGTYAVRLTVNNGADFKDVNITVDDNFPDPLNIRFAHVKNILQNVLHNGTTRCRDCHKDVAVPAPTQTPPVWYTSFDRDGTGAVDSTDDDWFLKAISGRVNLTEIGASPLLRKPTGNHHNGLKVIDTADTSSNGGLRNYSIFYNWVLAGMQPGGVASNPLVNPANTLTFSGSPLFSTGIALDGATSVGATNFLWTVSGPSGPTGAAPVISNPTSPSAAVLNVPNVGTYLVQLHVDDGISSDAVQRSIIVSETPVTADFSPGAAGVTSPQAVSFSGANLRGDISLSSTSSGSPANCHWQVTGPAVATLDGSAVLDVTKSCSVPALLNVSSANINNVYSVTLTAISPLGVPSIPVTHNLQIQSAGSGVVANAGANSSNTLTFTNPTTSVGLNGVTAPDSSGFPVATVSLNGGASTGPGTLTYTWSVFSQPGNATGSYIATITNATSVAATLNVHRPGTYVIKLVVDNTLPQGPGNTAFRTINVSANASTFTTLKANFTSLGCTGCHTTPGTAARPSWEDVTDGGLTLYGRVTALVNSTDPTQSRFLICPAHGCVGGMPQQSGFGVTNTNVYTAFLNWIIGGVPP